MRHRLTTAVKLACACACTLLLANTARAADSTDVAVPAQPNTAAAEPAKPATLPVKTAPAVKAAPASVDAVVKGIDAQIAKLALNKKDPAWKTKLKLPVVAKFDAAKSYFARMKTNRGEMLIKFKPDVAPMHVTNFIYLARMGFYDGTKFHRVIKGFMAQGGDPLGNGRGGPGYGFGGEFNPKVKHDGPGVLSTANAGPGTDGSQFFIMFRAYPSLDGSYTIFGQVEEGMDTVKAMEAVANPSDGPPTQPITVTQVTIEVR